MASIPSTLRLMRYSSVSRMMISPSIVARHFVWKFWPIVAILHTLPLLYKVSSGCHGRFKSRAFSLSLVVAVFQPQREMTTPSSTHLAIQCLCRMRHPSFTTVFLPRYSLLSRNAAIAASVIFRTFDFLLTVARPLTWPLDRRPFKIVSHGSSGNQAIPHCEELPHALHIWSRIVPDTLAFDQQTHCLLTTRGDAV